MSFHPSQQPNADTPDHGNDPVSFKRLLQMYQNGEPITMLTAFDFPSGELADTAGVDTVLVGDSAAMTVLGYHSTNEITVDELLTLTKAVRRGVKRALLIGDLPFGSYEESDQQAVRTAQRFVTEAGCDAVKLEGAGSSIERVKAIKAAGIAVVGHVGLTPQSAEQLGGYRAQGTTAQRALEVTKDALELEAAGCCMIVIEAVPAAVTEQIVRLLKTPTIGIGAGPSTAGQVLVMHDLLGIYSGHKPRFVKAYADLRSSTLAAIGSYVSEVKQRLFPLQEHSYSINPEELATLKKQLEQLNRD